MSSFRIACAAVAVAVVVLRLAVRTEGGPLPAVVTTPQPGVLDVTTGDLPKTPIVAVQIRKGTLAARGMTIWHTHPSPVFVYVETGTGSWEFRGGRPSQTRGAGQAIEEPPNTVTRIVNTGTSRMDLVIFQVSKPGDPVLVPAN
jgi:quercetin dioxygenase-like cupin family protein